MKTKKQIIQDNLSEGYSNQVPIGIVIEKCMEEYAEAKAGQNETLVNYPIEYEVWDGYKWHDVECIDYSGNYIRKGDPCVVISDGSCVSLNNSKVKLKQKGS